MSHVSYSMNMNIGEKKLTSVNIEKLVKKIVKTYRLREGLIKKTFRTTLKIGPKIRTFLL